MICVLGWKIQKKKYCENNLMWAIGYYIRLVLKVKWKDIEKSLFCVTATFRLYMFFPFLCTRTYVFQM